MSVAHSTITSEGQLAVPDEIRRILGLRPGSVTEWHHDGDRVVLCRAEGCTSEEGHRAVFAEAPSKAPSLGELKDGIRTMMKAKHARRCVTF